MLARSAYRAAAKTAKATRLHSMSTKNGISPPRPVQDERTVPPMGLTSQAFEAAASSVISDIARYYDTISERPVLPSVEPGYLQKLLPVMAPEHGESWEAILGDMESKIMPGASHWQSPNYHAFFPANSTYPSILAEMWSAALTSANFNWICSPVVTELETIVMDWMAKALALPTEFLSQGKGGGVIQGSASEAVATVMIAARDRYLRNLLDRESFSSDEAREDRMHELKARLVHVTSEQTHSGAQKAAVITGVRHRTIKVHAKDNFALRGDALRAALEEQKAKGLHPFMLTATIGTTNTCSIDDLAEIAAVKRDYPDLWIHIDAAYAGAALILPEYQHLTRHFQAFDSFEVNMHKWLLVNFDCACLYVQDRRSLTDALSVTPSYLRNNYTDSGLVTDYRDWQIPLGRRFRALKIWFVMRTYGLDGMRKHLRHHIKLGEFFSALVKSREDLFELLMPPAFALTVLTVRPRTRVSVAEVGDGADPRPFEGSQQAVLPEEAGEALKEANAITKQVYELINDEKEIFITGTVVGGVYAIRVVSANPLAEEKYVRRAFDILVNATERVLDKGVSV